PRLAQLDLVGDVDDAVQDAEAGVGYVVDERAGTHSESGGDVAGGRRLELLATDAGVNEDVDVARLHVGGGEGLAGGGDGAVGERVALLPPPAFCYAGHRFELPHRQS